MLRFCSFFFSDCCNNAQLYREEASSGRIYVSLSSDSTCITQLKSATTGYESMILSPIISSTTIMTSASSSLGDEGAKCRFPDWTQAKWESGKIDGSVFLFKDEGNNYQTLTSKCITRQTPYPSTSNDRYIIHSTTQWYVLHVRHGNVFLLPLISLSLSLSLLSSPSLPKNFCVFPSSSLVFPYMGMQAERFLFLLVQLCVSVFPCDGASRFPKKL